MPADHVWFYYYAQRSPWHLMWFWKFFSPFRLGSEQTN